MATDKEQSILTEAQGLVHGDRNSDYGHPLDDFSRTAAIWTALLGGKLKDGARIGPEDVGLCMVGVKLSRQINQPKRDNLTDAAGYCETVRMVIDERARRENKKFGPAVRWRYVRESDEEKGSAHGEGYGFISEEVGDRVIERLFPGLLSAAKREGPGST